MLLRFHELELVCHDELQSGDPWRTRDECIAFHRSVMRRLNVSIGFRLTVVETTAARPIHPA